jgi:cytochrome c biogenesis protein CcmG/thiol:disulfide interchange protein DsbE
MTRYLRYLVPLGIFAVLVAFLFRGLSLDPKLVPSPLVGKPMPAFSLTRLDDPNATISDADIKGKGGDLRTQLQGQPCRGPALVAAAG